MARIVKGYKVRRGPLNRAQILTLAALSHPVWVRGRCSRGLLL